MSVKAPHQRAHWHDAYDAQMALWRWYRTPPGRDFLVKHYRDSAATVLPSTADMLRGLYEGEMGRLLDCDPIYVSEEMCELVDVARESFAPEPLLETDLMTTRAFLYWAKSLVVPDRFEEPVALGAISWARMFGMVNAENDYHQAIAAGEDPEQVENALMKMGGDPRGIAITLYVNVEDTLTLVRPTRGHDHWREWRERGWPRLVPMHLTPWYYNMTFDGNDWDELDKPTGAEWWWRAVQTTLRLMQQTISARSYNRPDRGLRRDAKAAGRPNEAEVVVVRLRREEGPRGEPTGDKANYSHRFIRSGHWRNHWYPSAHVHRQIWIAPTVVGDPSLPLIVRPRRVYQWER